VVVRISHSLDSWLLYVHPPLAVIGYILTFTLLFTLIRYRKDEKYRKIVSGIGIGAWILNFLGLVTGMIWAYTAWGRPFAFDPKETFTLLLFLSVGSNLYLFYRRKNKKILVVNGIISCILIIMTVAVPLFLSSLHGYG
jgi:ABC-type transport system involved in cytochrome c biogenesis permease subunit